MPTFPLLFIQIQLAVGVSRGQIISKPLLQALQSPDPSSPTPGLGERCVDACSTAANAVCQNSTCVCHPSFPVPIKEKQSCFKAILLGEDCEEDLQCKFYDQNAVCKRFSTEYMECTCMSEYVMREIDGLKPPKVCFPGTALSQQDIQTFLGMGVGLSLMSALICLALRMFAKARFARPRRYANAAIPPPLTVSETYAAFALAAAENARNNSGSIRSHGARSASSSRRTSYASLQHQRAGNLLRLSSASSLSHQRPGSRRPSVNSIRSYRSQTGLVLPDSRLDRDHYILYMIRGPAHSLTSETTTTTTCDSISPRTPKSAEQILAVYQAVPEHQLLDLGIVGPSHTTSTFKTMSSEDIFQEEEEEEMETEEEDEEEDEEDEESRELKYESSAPSDSKSQTSGQFDSKSQTSGQFDSKSQTSGQFDSKSQTSEQFDSKSQTSTKDDPKSLALAKDDSKSQTSLQDEIKAQTSSRSDHKSLAPPRTDSKRRPPAQSRVAVHYELRRLPPTHSESLNLLSARESKSRAPLHCESNNLVISDSKSPVQGNSKSPVHGDSKSPALGASKSPVASVSKSSLTGPGKSKRKSTFGANDSSKREDLDNKL